MASKNVRAGLLAGLGALLLTVLAIATAIWLLVFRTSEQERFMTARGKLCERGKTESCDALRSACEKRSGEACVALADAQLAPGPKHDVREALRLLDDGCTHHYGPACSRGGRVALSGTELPKDVPRAKDFLRRGCEIGQKDDCALVEGLASGGAAEGQR